MLFNQAWKELRTQPRFVFLFLVNLALGLSGLITMEAFRNSLQASLRENAQNLLSADLAISSRRPLTTPEETIRKQLEALSLEKTSLTETFSMAKGKNGSRLVLLRAIGPGYPLRGGLDLQKRGRIPKGGAHQLLNGEKVWIDPDLARQLRLSVGDPLVLGKKQFTVDDIVTLDPTQSFRGMALAGRILLTDEGLQLTELIRPESTVTFATLYGFSEKINVASVAKEWSAKFPDGAVQVKSAGDSAEESGRLLSYLADFLGLSALVALFLSSLGSAYLFRTWLIRRSRTFAVHQVLGLTFWQAARIPSLQNLLLSCGSVPLALILAKFELWALGKIIKEFSPVEVPASLSFSSFLLAFGIAFFGSLLLALPFLVSLRALDPRSLLEGKLPEPKFGPLTLLLFFPAGALLYGLSVYESQSFRTAAVFFFSLMGALVFLLLVGWIGLWSIGKIAKISILPWPLKHGFLYLSRRGFQSISAFIALALGALLLNLLPQIRASLMAELENPDQKKLPSLFLFDIQEEQLSPLVTMLESKGVKIENLSPLVRARLLSINGLAFEKQVSPTGFRTREEETEARFRNRGFNLSYRSALSSSEEIVEGRPFSPNTLEISVEKRFADRLGLKLGDALLFDVQGVQITGSIVNLRKVRWTSFQPNFFVLFQDGPLNGAPKIFLGSLPEMADSKKEEIQGLMAEAFPNISSVDVRATVQRALELANRMRWSLTLMSVIALFSGAVVLLSIAQRQAEMRKWDLNLCSILGASPGELQFQQLMEFGFLSFMAGSFGGALSVAITWISSYFFFEGNFVFASEPLLYSVFGTTLLGIGVSFWGAQSIWRQRPSVLLQEQSH